ncbi:hypothetical protein EBZ37_03600 [bacterium]|nr:hypothetical protein [bacterium]
MDLSSLFIFVSCQPGAEAALKEEVAREHPRLRFAFSRTGLITFKESQGRPISSDFQLSSVFARAYGLSLGQCKSPDSLLEAVKYAQDLFVASGKAPLRLHVWERSEFVPGEEPVGFQAGIRAARIESQLRADASAIFHSDVEAQEGELVFDVIVLDDSEEPSLFVGFHRHGMNHQSWPGGEIPVSCPDSAPSRAFLKIEQAIRWGRLPVASGEVAVELGSAPGGASYALLLRGLEVWGIDPGAMSPVVWTDPRCEKRFHHVKKTFSDLTREELPESAHWIILDINGPARVSLPYVESLVSWFKRDLLGVVLTIKLNDPKHSRHIPEWTERISELGLRQVRARQLPSNKREICVVGLTGRGLLRLQKRSS